MKLIAISIPCILALLTSIVAMWTHIVYCFQNAEYVLLLVGIIASPYGVIHGIGLLMGWW